MLVKVYIGTRPKRLNRSGRCNIDIVIYSRRKYGYINTGFSIRPEQFKNGEVCRVAGSESINKSIQLKLSDVIRRLQLIENSDQLTGPEIVRRLQTETSRASFNEVCTRIASRYRSAGRLKSASLYQYAVNVVYQFSGLTTFDRINPGYLYQLEAHLRKSGLKINSIAVIFRYIRAVFNVAINEGLTAAYPFRPFKLRTEKTSKRSLTAAELRQVFAVNHYAVDLFRLSFLLLGINMKDILTLRRSDLVDGRLIFNRSKTRRLYSILVPPEAAEIISRYAGRDLLLNFMETRRDYNQFLRRVNMHLKRNGEALQLSKKLTTYCARHSWATIASGLGISQDVIRAALGHGMNTITDIYIDFDLRRVDEANRAVIDYMTVK